jgi:hypothetical protein
MKFTHGDKVTCYIDGVYIDDAKISIDADGTPYICQNIIKGVEGADNNLGYKYTWALFSNFTDTFVTDLKLARTEITWDNLQEGDVIISDGDEDLVRGICGSIIFLSPVGDKSYSRGYYAKEELMEGCTIKQRSQPIPDEVQKAIEHLQIKGYKVTKI